MLILTRRVGETVVISWEDESGAIQTIEIRVTVLGLKGNQARIGIEAPKNIIVHREEIYERIRREKEEKLQNPGIGSNQQEAVKN